VFVQRLPQKARRQPQSGGGIRRSVESEGLHRAVSVLLRHDGPLARDRRKDVHDQRRRTQHDVAVTGGRHLRARVPPTPDAASQADILRTANDVVVADNTQRPRQASNAATATTTTPTARTVELRVRSASNTYTMTTDSRPIPHC